MSGPEATVVVEAAPLSAEAASSPSPEEQAPRSTVANSKPTARRVAVRRFPLISASSFQPSSTVPAVG
jgi:hypothetical protein